MSNDIAISFKDVHQSYPLYSNPREMILGVLGINKFFCKQEKVPLFHALKGINLNVYKGERLGVIGQNGAGKTTLLKLTTRNFFPTHGEVKINGKVQSLMDSGVGFHPEFTGLENIKSSLVYNGLSVRETKKAIEDIIDFSELGDFIHQPIKTYSLGMVSRLGFATSTALHPEILIIDEIMGAGDAYFAAKSAERMHALTQNGTTLLLVSHSTAQVIQFCQKVIWMKEGQIHMKGEALEVCKAYEIYMRDLDEQRLEKANRNNILKRTVEKKEVENLYTENVDDINSSAKKDGLDEGLITVTKRSLSRWKGLGKLFLDEFYMTDNEDKRKFTFQTGEKVNFTIKTKAQKEGYYTCTYVMVIYSLTGQPVTLHTYVKNENFNEGEIKTLRITYPELMLGNGDFVVSLAIYKQLDLNDTSTALFYDLLDRSFEFKVINKMKQDNSLFLHPAKWSELD